MSPNFELIAQMLGDYYDLQADGIVDATNRFPLSAIEEQITQLGSLQLASNATLANRIVELTKERVALTAQVDGLMKIVQDNALVHISANKAEISAQAIEGAIKFCNHHMAFPVNHGKVADKVIAVDDLIMYAETLRQGGAE